jgi:hypothetical protein
MNDEAFARLIAEEVKNKATEAQKKYLALPENRDRWKRGLTALASNLDRQIEQINAYEKSRLEEYEHLGDEGIALIAETSANFNARRAKIERFNFFVSQKLDEVIRLAASFASGEETEDLSGFYRRAIQKWWSLMDEYELEPTPIDEALYAVLDGKWEFDSVREEDFDDFGD